MHSTHLALFFLILHIPIFVFLSADLGNQTVAIVQPSVWTGHVERSAAIIVTMHSILFSCCSQSGCSCSLFLSLRLSSVSRILLQVLPVLVWHSCSLTMRDETWERSCRLGCSDILHAVTLLLQKILYTEESWMSWQCCENIDSQNQYLNVLTKRDWNSSWGEKLAY